MSRIARLSWPGYLVVASLFGVVVAVIAALIWNAAGESDAVIFGLTCGVVVVAGLAYGRDEIRTFFS